MLICIMHRRSDAGILHKGRARGTRLLKEFKHLRVARRAMCTATVMGHGLNKERLGAVRSDRVSGMLVSAIGGRTDASKWML
jgi:hypothetical protein